MLASCLGCIYSGGGFKYFLFSPPILGEDELILTSVFFNGGGSTTYVHVCIYIYSVFIPESSNGLKFGFQKPDRLGLKLDTHDGGSRYVCYRCQ